MKRVPEKRIPEADKILLSKPVQKLLHTRYLEIAFCKGWRDTTDGVIFSQAILDYHLMDCPNTVEAYNRGVRAATELLRLSGRYKEH